MTRTRIALLLVAALMFLTSAPATAAAEPQRIGYSTDGVSYVDALTEPLFASGVRWVPGDVQTSTFYVRNQAESAATLRVELKPTADDDLLETTWLAVSAIAGSDAFPAVNQGGPATLVDNVEIAQGDAIPVEVRVELLPEAPNTTKLLSSQLDFAVSLTDARAAAPPDVPDTADHPDQTDNPGDTAKPTDWEYSPMPTTTTSGPGGLLPDTGSSVTWLIVTFALLLILLGAFLARPSGRNGRHTKGARP